jgi:hypothetical protein
MDYTKDIRAYIALEQEILSQLDVDAINDCLNFLDETRLKKGRIYICGNGGHRLPFPERLQQGRLRVYRGAVPLPLSQRQRGDHAGHCQ